jgi:glucarate dehydratase
MPLSRRDVLAAAAGGLAGGLGGSLIAPDPTCAQPLVTALAKRPTKDLTIKEVRVTPIALPDPPLLAAGGCHGPYFLRTIVEVITAEGVSGVGETNGNERAVLELKKAAKALVGQSALAYRKFQEPPLKLSNRAYGAVEVACLDAIGKATGLRLCELLGGPVRENPEFAAYLFFRYAADHPAVLGDKRIVDGRGRGDKTLDQWGEVRTPAAMAELAWQFHQKYGFRVHKLKAGVLKPETELEALQAISEKFSGKPGVVPAKHGVVPEKHGVVPAKHQVRIDPNARWSVATAIDIGRDLQDLPLEYYEDPVAGQEAMAEVRRRCDVPMSTNMCVVEFDDIPPAIPRKCVDVVLADHHYWGGITACQSLGVIARTLGWQLSQHSNNHTGVSMAAMIHVAALISELTVASDTHYPWLLDSADIITGGKLPIRDGRMSIPTGAGLGIELDRDKLARAHETYLNCGMRDRNDADTMRMVQPGWEKTIL